MRTMLLAALMVCAWQSDAQAACNLAQFGVTGVTAVYDPFEDSFTPDPVAIALQTDDSKDCKDARIQFAITFTPSSPQTGSELDLKNAGADLFARLEGPAGHAHPVSDPGSAFENDPNSYPLGRAGLLSSAPVLQLAVKPGQAVPPGTYGAELTLLARVTDSQNEITNFSAPLSVAVAVKPSVRLAAGTGGMTIDVGELKKDATGGPIRFDAYANVDYDLRLVSDNDFTLVRNGRDSPKDGVPYLPSISGAEVDSAAANGDDRTRKIGFAAPSGGLRHHTMSVRILAFAGLRAGQYSDFMTIEIRPKI